jgi:integrase
MGLDTSKTTHMMRALKGSFWRAKFGLDRAHDWLGHKSYQTTLDHYAGLPTAPEPAALD